MPETNFKYISNEDLTERRFSKNTDLLNLLSQLADSFGFLAVYDDGTLLLDESITRDGKYLGVYSKVLSAIGMEELTVVVAERQVVYQEYLKQLKELSREETGDGAAKINRGEMSSLFTSFISEAVAAKASDIHLSLTSSEQASYYYRINGLVDVTPKTKSRMQAAAMIGNLFEWTGEENAKNKNFNDDEDNDTSISNIIVPVGGIKKNIEVRVHYRSLTELNKVCTFRILNTGETVKTLEELGINPKTSIMLRNAMKMEMGIILVSGPTGAGKSTTLVACMTAKPKDKILHTIEDPIESTLADPLSFQGQQGDDPEKDIAGFMRTDLDIGGVGEMLNGAQAKAAFGLARTGHLILSTLHANDAMSQVERLIDMGMSRAEIGEKNLLRILTAQRLVPMLCPDCKELLTEEDLEEFSVVMKDTAFNKLRENLTSVYKAKLHGCKKCDRSGYIGRKLVFEFIYIDEAGRQFIRSGDSAGWLNHLRQNGWRSMADVAWEGVFSGVFDLVKTGGIVPDLIFDSNEAYRYEYDRE